MTTLFITEFARLGVDQAGHLAAPQQPPVVQQSVAIGAGSVACANGFDNATRFVELFTDTACSIAFGAAPTAVATAGRMAANERRLYAVNPGDKVAVIN